MTAVAPPPNFQAISRWNNGNDAPNGLNTMSADDVSRMLMPRKTAQRSNSSSSLASSASSSSTISASSNGGSSAGSSGDWGTRKKPARSLWSASKAEPITGLSTARPQSIASTSGPSAASAISALHTPSSMLPSQSGGQSQVQQNGASRTQVQPENAAILHLSPMNGTFERKTITVPFFPDVLRIGRQTNNKTIPTPLNGYFDSKVLSRQHAEVWADRNGKIWIRDVKSSNGTFVNGQRLSQENKDSDPHELREQDMLELGIDIVSEDQKTVVHHKVAAKVEHAGYYSSGNSMMDLNYGELDAVQNGIMSAAQLSQMRGRPGSQGSMVSNGRLSMGGSSMAGSNMTGMSHHRQPLWLQTITMDQVVKKIQSEFRQTKQQKSDLERATQFIESLMTTETKKEVTKPSPIKSSPIKGDLKARFSDPPAPPPQQPLPEKPDVAHSALDKIFPGLKRSDTERPKIVSSNSSPITKTNSSHNLEISSLVAALHSAKQDIEEQSLRLRRMEDELERERVARESAEERAQRLETEHRKDTKVITNGIHPLNRDEEDSVTPIDDESDDDVTIVEEPQEAAPSTTLQQRLDSVLHEMSEMKLVMEKYRRRAESAEAESAKDRQTLAEMIEKHRQESAERTRSSHKKQRSGSQSTPAEVTTFDGTEEKTDLNGEPSLGPATAMVDIVKEAGVQNGHPVTPEQIEKLEQMVNRELRTRSRKEEHIRQVAPLASLLAVVFTGLGLMAYLNAGQKIER
ncbi:hypothetical protein K402DRAFT_423389 [Aulographum hederae CBS 113979]|uniref:FHA domain-containing protein n=1 Tax=Aulographum hederae CBS 113979 TaxID=1176131 RepID=A0A6G1GS71_9PEZI|nr:hypothetical protein K402DRAFT_423389 [Aulographum hederae CBS 113979]